MEVGEELLSLIAFPEFLSSANRPIRLRLHHPKLDLDEVLLPQVVTGSEAVCSGIEYRVSCIAASCTIPLKELIALPVAIDLVTDRGELHTISGIVTEVASGGSDGGVASYQLVVRDALSILEKRVNTRVFRNMNELEIVAALLREWRQKNPVIASTFSCDAGACDLAAYPAREFTMQHNESDATFLKRLLRRRGIAWYFRSVPDVAVPAHKLVLFNDANILSESAASPIRYHRDGATEERDSLTAWTAFRKLQPGSVTRHSWDYKIPGNLPSMSARVESGMDQGPNGAIIAASLEDYQAFPPHAGDNEDDLRQLGKLRISRLDFEAKCFYGEGCVRDLRVAEYFTLMDHPEVDTHPPDGRAFVVTELQLWTRNNLPEKLSERLSRLFAQNRWIDPRPPDAETGTSSRFHCRLTAVRRGIPIVPAYDPRIDQPVPPMQTAIVVGPPGEEVHCDNLGRVKIRFPAARPTDHEHANGAGASDTDVDSAWVRVASSWAGNGPGNFAQCGAGLLPRVNSEVLVAFVGGDPDKPIIVGQLYNQQGEPPALSARGGLPGNRYLSGLKSRKIGSTQANQLRFDDTNGQISAQLASDHSASHLNLGFLTQPREGGTGEKRGEGGELRSDSAVAVRGGGGVLVTAEGTSSEAHQLERSHLLKLTEALQALAGELAKVAASNAKDAQPSDNLAQLIEKLKGLEKSAAPIVAIDGPNGIAVSGANALIGAETDCHVIAGADTRIVSGGATQLRAEKGVSILAHQEGAKLIAARGKVVGQAQDGELELLAKKVLEIISTTDWINIKARKGVRLYGGGSEVEISEAGIACFTNAAFKAHAAEHLLEPRQSRSTQFPDELPFHEICVSCLLNAAKAHSPFATAS